MQPPVFPDKEGGEDVPIPLPTVSDLIDHLPDEGTPQTTGFPPAEREIYIRWTK